MEKKLNILICGDSLDVGGAETHIVALSNALSRMGHRVTVASRSGVLRSKLARNVRFENIDFSHVGAIIRLGMLIKNGKFDIVHAHSRRTSFAVNTVRRILPKIKFGFAVTAHALYGENRLKDSFSVWGDACIAVSHDIERMVRTRFHVPKRSILCVPNGIDTNKFHSCTSKAFGQKLLFVSRLDSDCSLGAFCLCRIIPRLAKHYKGVTLTVVGGGDRLNEIKELAKRANRTLGRRAVKVTGAVADVSGIMAECDCVVGVSRVALEAAAMGKNVILFGNEGGLGLLCCENWNVASDTNFTARGCGVKDEKFLEREILELFETDSKYRSECAEFCKKRVVSEYTDEMMARKTLTVYSKILPHPVILIGGYYGFGNIGDEAVRSNLIRGIRKELPSARIMSLTASPRGKNEISRRSPIEIARAMRKADIYVSGGGSLFQDSTSLRTPVFYCALILFSRLMGCRAAVLDNGIGPLTSPISKAVTRIALRSCDYISLRDIRSLSEARRLVGKNKAVRLAADPVFSEKLTEPSGGDGLAVCFKREALFEIAATYKISPHIVPIAMDRNGDMGMFPESFEEGMEIMKKCDGAVGSRLHFLIMALLCRVPFAPIGTDPKIEAFSEMTLGVPPIDPLAFTDIYDLSKEMKLYLSLSRKFYEQGGREKVIVARRDLFEKDMRAFSLLCVQR